jgi:hypothetical protein
LILSQLYANLPNVLKSRPWTWDELILAFNLYCAIPFGQYHRGNPKVIGLAKLIGRTPGAVAMKLSNFASFDPMHEARNVGGLSHAGKVDRDVWEAFHGNWEELAYQSEQVMERSVSAEERESGKAEDGQIPKWPEELEISAERTEKASITRTRLVQSFFRKTVLTSYENRCAICSLTIPALLVAGHIIPWSADVMRRADPTNGLCLCAFHDRAFDRGYIGLDENLRVLVSPEAEVEVEPAMHKVAISDIKGKQIYVPGRFGPDSVAVEYHRVKVYRSGIR